MKSEPLVSTQILLPVVEQFRREGGRAEPLLSTVGIDRDKLNDVNHFVPLGSYVRFFEAASQTLRNEYFGLECGRSMDSGSLGAISFLFMSAPTLHDAFRGLTEYLDALQTGTDEELTIERGVARFSYCINDDSIAPRRQDAEYSISATYHLIARYTGRSFRPREVFFEHERVGAYATYREFFGCDVFFGQDSNAISFDAAALNISAPSLSDKLYPIIVSHLQERMRDRQPQQSFSERVAGMLDLDGSNGAVGVKRVAVKLGVSESTVLRRLKAEGTSFSQLLTEKRMNTAKRLLVHSELPISEIALKVGYAENASFTRAFKAWYNTTPEKFRSRN